MLDPVTHGVPNKTEK